MRLYSFSQAAGKDIEEDCREGNKVNSCYNK